MVYKSLNIAKKKPSKKPLKSEPKIMDEFGFNICIMKRIKWGGFGFFFNLKKMPLEGTIN
jgi:hypothetical protein